MGCLYPISLSTALSAQPSSPPPFTDEGPDLKEPAGKNRDPGRPLGVKGELPVLWQASSFLIGCAQTEAVPHLVPALTSAQGSSPH
jgi:hypothetical protein